MNQTNIFLIVYVVSVAYLVYQAWYFKKKYFKAQAKLDRVNKILLKATKKPKRKARI